MKSLDNTINYYELLMNNYNITKNEIRKIEYFVDEKGNGCIVYLRNEDIFIRIHIEEKKLVKKIGVNNPIELYLKKVDDSYNVKFANIIAKEKISMELIKDKIELSSAIVTILSFLLTIIKNDSKIDNEININCNNCTIQVVKQNNNINIECNNCDVNFKI